ncbi:hypothetical protein [Catenovulum sediminis]|uniref:Uncharacterized protein n=1 Tax=Catenovulum sediminis TaxID=1740262 RepID=A0ABV1RCM8_9ALTE
MTDLRFYFLICCLLFLSGLVTGQFFSCADDVLDAIVKITAIVSSMVTICGVVLAYFSLNSWKAQYKYSKVDNLIDELEDSFWDLQKEIYGLYHAILMVSKYHDSAGVNESYEELKSKQDLAQNKYSAQKSIYKRLYYKLNRHANDQTIEVIKPKYIERQATKLFQKAVGTYKTPGDSGQKLNEGYDHLTKLDKYVNDGFTQLRKKLSKLAQDH